MDYEFQSKASKKPAHTRKEVFVPKWVTKVVSVLLSGGTMLLFIVYGIHLGRAAYYGIPNSYISLSPDGILPYVIPGLLTALLSATQIVPVGPAIRGIVKLLW